MGVLGHAGMQQKYIANWSWVSKVIINTSLIGYQFHIGKPPYEGRGNWKLDRCSLHIHEQARHVSIVYTIELRKTLL
jgi:hypothetical protein